MKKLCIITTVPITITSHWGKQLEFLQSHGFAVTVIAAPDDRFAGWLPPGVDYRPVRMSRVLRPWEDICSLFSLIRILKKGGFDVVQYATPKGALFGSIAAWYARVPVRLYLMWGLYYVTQKGFKRAVFKCFEKIACRLSTDIAPDSKGNVRFAVEEGLCGPEKIGVVGYGSANGVDTERFDPDRLSDMGREIRKDLNIPDRATVFGCITAIVGDKGINELIEAFDVVSREYPGAYLLYIGQTTEKDPVKDSTLEILKNHKRIVLLGWQTEPEKYMAAMDVFVLPTYREGFGVVNVEASAMRLPVISTDVPGPQESIVNGETGILVPAKQVEPLITAMKDMLERPSYAERLGKAGRKRVKELYEQKELWEEILQHRIRLIEKRTSGKAD
jgi:glycosyltransferase involved in cell wall biosynthesis